MKNHLFQALCCVSVVLTAQYANAQQSTPPSPMVTQLGEAPMLKPSTQPPAMTARQLPLSPRALKTISIDPSNRQSVVNAYLNDFLPLFNVPMNWTGDIDSCDAGQTSTEYAEATIDAVNYFRAMVNLPSVTHDSSLDNAAQQAALMMVANQQLSHHPASSWKCYTPAGAASAGKSNLYLRWGGSQEVSAPNYIRGYVIDSGDNNKRVGHRRWIIYPKARAFGTGTVGSNGIYSNALNVLSASRRTRPTTSEIIAWPPKGYVPQQLLTEWGDADAVRWSFSVNSNTSADYTNATVTMTETTTGGSVVNTSVIDRNSYGYGDSSLVWETPNLELKPGEADRTFSITISNIANAPQSSYHYTVTVIDPKPTYGISGQLTGFKSGMFNYTSSPYERWIKLQLTHDSTTTNAWMNQDGSFQFSQRLQPGEDYQVSVAWNPHDQICQVQNDTGTNIQNNVDNLLVECVDKQYTLGGSFSNLKGTIKLANGANEQTFTSTNTFAFNNKLNYYDDYQIEIKEQPASQQCRIKTAYYASGKATGNQLLLNQTEILCEDKPTLDVNVTNLKGSLVLRANNDSSLTKTITADSVVNFGVFSLGQSYSMSIVSHPDKQQCQLTQHSNNIIEGIEATVSCIDLKSLNGNANNLKSAIGLKVNGHTADYTVLDFGLFPAGENYQIEITQQPNKQRCQLVILSYTVGDGAEFSLDCVDENITVDSDNDGISDADETANGTDPNKADSDGDGKSDQVEGIHDTDGDGKIDAIESSKADQDNDGVVDSSDKEDTNPHNDSDGDGFSNTKEKTEGTNPLDKNSKPTTEPVKTGIIFFDGFE